MKKLTSACIRQLVSMFSWGMGLGLAVGGGTGFGVPWLIKDKKLRKYDNLRL